MGYMAEVEVGEAEYPSSNNNILWNWTEKPALSLSREKHDNIKHEILPANHITRVRISERILASELSVLYAAAPEIQSCVTQ